MSLKTSIILCTYNEANYIKQTIIELEKNIPDLELIIVDDNSTDDTKKILNQLNHDKRLKIIYRNLSKYFNLLCRLLLRPPIKDFTTSIFLMKKQVLDEVTFLGYGHGEFFIEFLHNAHKKGFKITEIPFIQKKDDNSGESKSSPNLIRFFYLGLMYLLRVLTTITRRE